MACRPPPLMQAAPCQLYVMAAALLEGNIGLAAQLATVASVPLPNSTGRLGRSSAARPASLTALLTVRDNVPTSPLSSSCLLPFSCLARPFPDPLGEDPHPPSPSAPSSLLSPSGLTPIQEKTSAAFRHAPPSSSHAGCSLPVVRHGVPPSSSHAGCSLSLSSPAFFLSLAWPGPLLTSWEKTSSPSPSAPSSLLSPSGLTRPI
eukprot:CAMPEP_0171145384 /NCGR_PEP_ID=MMETSP0766_2-20121228/147036_1 /TAXON_ID=439317 /ORGANISM="Gambierdiscus australes, Strain CAWD 149" /LENGTH=203 /DNA_ID=CAMNT_0011609287 /DNA_START=1 /DNA_END=612 /DNA_ORIENTATION=+